MGMRVGLIGVGDVFEEHFCAMNEVGGLELVALADVDKKRNPDFSVVKFYTDYKEMLEDPRIDAVIIATPNYLHEEMASNALNAGKHVLLEKPVTATLEQAKRLARFVGEADRNLTVSYHFGFKPENIYFAGMREEIGKIKNFEVRLRSPLPETRQWLFNKKKGGGVWIDSGPNGLSALRAAGLNNLKLVEANFRYGQRSKIEDRSIEDYARIRLSNGETNGEIVADWRMPTGKVDVFSVFETDKAVFVLDHVENTIHRDGGEIFRETDRKGEEWKGWDKDRRYKKVYDDWLKRIKTGESNIWKAAEDIRLIEEAYELGNKN